MITYEIINEEGTRARFWYSKMLDSIVIEVESADSYEHYEAQPSEFLRVARLLQNDKDKIDKFPSTYSEEE